MRKYFFFYGLLSLTGLIACKKTVLKEEQNVTVIQQDTTLITGNTIPSDSTITQLTIESYINKSYISLIGRKPDDAELEGALALLKPSFNTNSRKLFIEVVLSNKEDYAKKLVDTEAQRLLNSTDTAIINESIFALEFLLLNPDYEDSWDIIHYELNRLYSLKTIQHRVAIDSATINEVHRVMVNNSFYDDINMGSENFVVSTFQHFLNRYPTSFELEEGKKMVEQFEGILFYDIGSSKEDYVQIFFQSDPYIEGLVKEAFSKYLLRDPTTEEIATYASMIKGDTYKSLLIELLSTSEYANVD